MMVMGFVGCDSIRYLCRDLAAPSSLALFGDLIRHVALPAFAELITLSLAIRCHASTTCAFATLIIPSVKSYLDDSMGAVALESGGRSLRCVRYSLICIVAWTRLCSLRLCVYLS
jgi:hypothetical protein